MGSGAIKAAEYKIDVGNTAHCPQAKLTEKVSFSIVKKTVVRIWRGKKVSGNS